MLRAFLQRTAALVKAVVFSIFCLAVLPASAATDPSGFGNWAARYAKADAAGRTNLLADGLRLARARRLYFNALIQTNPGQALALSAALPVDRTLPTNVVALLEKHLSGRGDYVVMCAFPSTNHPTMEAMRHQLRLGGKLYNAYTPETRYTQLSQFNIPVEAVAVDDAAAVSLAPATPADLQENPPTAWTTGGKNILVIRVDFSDLAGAPQGYTAAQIKSIADTQVAPYYAKSSYGLTTQTNTVTSAVYRMPHTAAYYATNNLNDQLHSDAQAAASANYTLANYDRLITYFASMNGIANSQITYGGLAQIGGEDVWCNGEFDFRVIAHEVGHTYGLYHGNLWQVSDGNPISPSGVDTEYGDDFDTMGANFANDQSTDFNPWFKSILGWIPDAQLQTVTTNGTYRVYAFDHNNYLAATNETLALKVVKDGTYTYWLACRTDFTNNTYTVNGVYIFWGYNYTRQSDLLDMNTTGSSDQDAPLQVGGIFNDPAAAGGSGVTFHPVDKGGTAPNEYRDIQITFGTAPPIGPTFTTQPAAQSGVLGQTVTFDAVASGSPAPTYQWQYKTTGGPAWINLVNNSTFSGVASSNLTVSLSALPLTNDLFQCVASNASGSVASSNVTVSILPALLAITLAGQPNNPGTGNGTGSGAQFYYPYDVVCDSTGNAYVLDYYEGAIRKVTPAGVVSTYASGFSGPEGLAIDAANTIYVSDSSDQEIRKVTTTGAVSLIAGSYMATGTNDGMNSAAHFNYPWGIAVDAASNLYVSDGANNTIRKISPSGANWIVTTIAGLAGVSGSTDGTNTGARFQTPASIAVDTASNLYVCDSKNNTIRKISPSGTNWITTTIAGAANASGGMDGVGTNALFYSPSGIALDPSGSGTLYVADSYNDLIRSISPSYVVTTIAGNYFVTGSQDGFYTNANFNIPYGIGLDHFGNIYVADTFDYTVRVLHVPQVTIPPLTATLTGSQAAVQWPEATQLFRLQSSTNLALNTWSNITATPTVINNTNHLTNLLSAPAVYYRLISP